MSLRVAIVINSLDLGGTETVVGRLATGARARGVEPRVYAVRQLGSAGGALRRAGVPVFSLGARAGLRGAPHLVGLAALRLGRILRREDVQVVHSFLFEANAVARLAARRARRRLVASFRSNVFRLPAERLLEQTTGPWVSAYTAVSQAVAVQAAATLGLERARIDIIHNGIEVSSPPSPPRAVRTLGFLGRLHREKGCDLLLRALARLGPTAPSLRVAGDGPQRAALDELVRHHALGDRVTFVGRVDDAAGFLDQVDAVVVPALGEGFSNAALEAMARARPVVASDAGGNRELVIDDETGYVVPAGDVDALASAIRRLCDGEPERLGAAGLTRVQREFTADRMIDRHIALWRRVARLPLPFATPGW